MVMKSDIAKHVAVTKNSMDITEPKYTVEVRIRHDGKVVWINIGGMCVFRACQIDKLYVEDERAPHDRC